MPGSRRLIYFRHSGNETHGQERKPQLVDDYKALMKSAVPSMVSGSTYEEYTQTHVGSTYFPDLSYAATVLRGTPKEVPDWLGPDSRRDRSDGEIRATRTLQSYIQEAHKADETLCILTFGLDGLSSHMERMRYWTEALPEFIIVMRLAPDKVGSGQGAFFTEADIAGVGKEGFVYMVLSSKEFGKGSARMSRLEIAWRSVNKPKEGAQVEHQAQRGGRHGLYPVSRK